MLFLPPITSILIIMIMALLAMAFFTLLERKILGYIQLRKGPNKVGILGLLQPFADALKLFSKELKYPIISNFAPLVFAPMLSLFLALSLWALLPLSFNSSTLSLGIIMFLCISSLNVYAILGAGWTSNSKYALLGALRAIAQTISYEVSMALILIGPLLIMRSFNLAKFLESPKFLFIMLLIPFVIWLTTLLAETNRTPFDFAEGESELVSGFNTEYSSGIFALIFMAEYASIIIMSFLTALIFFPTSFINIFTPPLIGLLIGMFVIWARGTLPRIRYDQLMKLTWKTFLPLSLAILMLISSTTI
uniref:NADH dehydrogenase subunit 1 n=1 Tax=Manayunkia occidentalis TaxID=2704156 RepID=UPI00165FBB55|nr:NADH dehydrogenase subunit 1 [Manayunkia occidentalis]QLM00889.1 NADH dehydrogenase subunit 1 [Manayunkia occidentalis]